MPRYRVVDISTFITSLHAVGEVVEYAGWPGSTLEPMPDDPVAQRIKKFYVEARERGRKIPKRPDLAQFEQEPKPEPEPESERAPPKASSKVKV